MVGFRQKNPGAAITGSIEKCGVPQVSLLRPGVYPAVSHSSRRPVEWILAPGKSRLTQQSSAQKLRLHSDPLLDAQRRHRRIERSGLDRIQIGNPLLG